MRSQRCKTYNLQTNHDQRLPQYPLLRMDSARACDRGHLRLCVAPQSCDSVHWLSISRHPLGALIDVASARGQLLPARTLAVPEWRGKFDRSDRRIGLSAIYGDDICSKVNHVDTLAGSNVQTC